MKTFIKLTAILALVFLAGSYIRQLTPSSTGDIPLLDFIAQYDRNLGLILSAIYVAGSAFSGRKNPLVPFTDDDGKKASRKNNTTVMSNNKITFFEFNSSREKPRTPRKKVRPKKKE